MNHTSYEKQLEDTVVGLESKIDELVKENTKLLNENKNLRKFERFYNKELEDKSDKPDTGDESSYRPVKTILLTALATFSWIAFFAGLLLSVSGLPATGVITMVTSLFFFIVCIDARSNA
jgi:hypothetical protein